MVGLRVIKQINMALLRKHGHAQQNVEKMVHVNPLIKEKLNILLFSIVITRQ